MTRALRALLDDHEVVDGGAAQADAFRRVCLRHPVVAAVDGVQHALLRQQLQQLAALGTELLALLEGELEGGALEVADADYQVVGVDEAGLRRRFEQVLGMSRHVLVQRRRVGDENGERRLVAATGATHLLPGAGQRARVAEQHGRVQPADVDSQLEGVGRGDGAHASAAQAGLDGAPLAGQVAAAITLDGRLARLRGQSVAEVAHEELDGQAAGREDDRLDALLARGAPPATAPP